MPRGGSSKGNPRGNAKKRIALEEEDAVLQSGGIIKPQPQPDAPYRPNFHDFGKSPLDES